MSTSIIDQALLARLSPLSGLGAESLVQAAAIAHAESFARSTQQPLAFSWEHKVVYLLRGELKLDYPDGSMKVCVGGYGETLAPLNGNVLVPVSARAITDVELLWFDETDLDILITWDQLVPPLYRPPQTDGQREADWRQLSGIFDARKLAHGSFANLPAAHIESLLASFQRQPVLAEEVIVRQGEPGDFYYLIERGRAQVTREIAGARLELAELEAGDAFGEEALLAGTARNATVTMRTAGELLRLDSADFVRLLREPLLQYITADEALPLVASGSVWLDVRFPAEFRQDGLPGAINIPLNELRDALPNLSHERDYIVYCQTGRRSSAAAFLLSQRGFAAHLLAGGLKAAVSAMEKVST
jgi:rhodanese-related sulfurtransferase